MGQKVPGSHLGDTALPLKFQKSSGSGKYTTSKFSRPPCLISGDSYPVFILSKKE